MLKKQISFLLLIAVIGCSNNIDAFKTSMAELELNTKISRIFLESTSKDGRTFRHIAISFLVTEETPREAMLADALTTLQTLQPLLKSNKKIDMVIIVFMLPALDEDGNIERSETRGVMGKGMLVMGLYSNVILETNLTNFNPTRLRQVTYLYRDNIDKILTYLAQERGE